MSHRIVIIKDGAVYREQIGNSSEHIAHVCEVGAVIDAPDDQADALIKSGFAMDNAEFEQKREASRSGAPSQPAPVTAPAEPPATAAKDTYPKAKL